MNFSAACTPNPCDRGETCNAADSAPGYQCTFNRKFNTDRSTTARKRLNSHKQQTNMHILDVCFRQKLHFDQHQLAMTSINFSLLV